MGVMDRSNHYEAAFEAYLQWHGLCYVAVDETRRARLGEHRVKNLDFIVHGENGSHLLIDVKGRRFPSISRGQPRRTWQCWSTREDVEGLERWEALFGPDFRGLLLFTYMLLPCVSVPEATEDLWTWRGQRYLFRAVPVSDYQRHMRVRSPRWGTVEVPSARFRELVRPLHDFTRGPLLLREEAPF